MNNPKINKHASVIDDDTLKLVGDSLAPNMMPAPRKMALFANIMDKVEQQEPAQETNRITVRANEGEWISLTPKIEKKLLFLDAKRKIESYLLKIQPGGELPAHLHTADEYCFVLEGDVMFDDIELHAGDFQIAKQGSWHSGSYSRNGALVYLESQIF